MVVARVVGARVVVARVVGARVVVARVVGARVVVARVVGARVVVARVVGARVVVARVVGARVVVARVVAARVVAARVVAARVVCLPREMRNETKMYPRQAEQSPAQQEADVRKTLRDCKNGLKAIEDTQNRSLHKAVQCKPTHNGTHALEAAYWLASH